MSGALSTFGLGGTAGLLSAIPGVGGVLGGTLSHLLTEAALGGVTFDMLDSRELAGRRVERVLFPQRTSADQIFQDFGNFEGPIRITGFLSGDDYVIRAQRMRAVLLKSGPVTLVHPWWGRLRVRLVQPGEIGFSAGQVRLAHFQCVVLREPPKTSGVRGFFQRITDTISNLVSQADALVDEVTLTVQGVLAPLAIPLALASGVSSVLSQAAGVWDGLTGAAPQPIRDGAASGIALLSAGVSAPVQNLDTSYADSVTAALTAVPAGICNAISDPAVSVVAPARQVSGVLTSGAAASDVYGVLLSGAEATGIAVGAVSRVSAAPGSVLALGVCARALIVSQVAGAWAALDFVSGADAVAARDRAVAAIDALLVDIENAAASGVGTSLSGIWQATQRMRTALIADCSAQVGRLPAVVSVSVSAPVPAWLLAYAVAGDDPQAVQGVLDDLVTRNAIDNPGRIGPGPVLLLENLS